jgi:hypothetical protein
VGFLILPGVAVLAAAGYCADVALRPWHPCPRCKEHRGRGAGSSSKAWNRCGRCSGKGELVRPGARAVRRAIRKPID